MKSIKKLSVERLAAAIEADAGQALPGLREALAEAKAGRAGRVHTPEQVQARRRGRPAGSVAAVTKEPVKLRLDPDVLAARHKKPDLPVREEAGSEDPIARIVFHPDARVNARWLDRWARLLAGWVDAGLHPYVFVHSPSNRESPAFARDLLGRIASRTDVGQMPEWPGEAGETASGQLALL